RQAGVGRGSAAEAAGEVVVVEVEDGLDAVGRGERGAEEELVTADQRVRCRTTASTGVVDDQRRVRGDDRVDTGRGIGRAGEVGQNEVDARGRRYGIEQEVDVVRRGA